MLGPRARALLGLAALAVYAFASLGAALVHELRPDPAPADGAPGAATLAPARIAALRARLGERRAVGFVTDGDPARPIYLVPELHELQYHVAPVVLDPDLAGKDLVVGRIDRPGSLAALCEQRGLAPVEDLGAGIVLLSSRGHAPPPFAGPPREREPR